MLEQTNKHSSLPAGKNQGDFLEASDSIVNIKGVRSCEETKQKGIRENASQSISFQNEKSP